MQSLDGLIGSSLYAVVIDFNRYQIVEVSTVEDLRNIFLFIFIPNPVCVKVGQ